MVKSAFCKKFYMLQKGLGLGVLYVTNQGFSKDFLSCICYKPEVQYEKTELYMLQK